MGRDIVDFWVTHDFLTQMFTDGFIYMLKGWNLFQAEKIKMEGGPDWENSEYWRDYRNIIKDLAENGS